MSESKAEQRAAIIAPILDYVQGWYDKDAARMARGLHPALAKRHLDPGAPDGVDQRDLAGLLEVVPRYGGTRDGRRRLDVEVLDVDVDIACARVISNDYVDYLHLVMWKGRWWVINVLWRTRQLT
jgi:hypothetical protein